MHFIVLPLKLLQGRTASGPVYREVDAILAGPFADELTAQRALIEGRFPSKARVQSYQVASPTAQDYAKARAGFDKRLRSGIDRMLGRK